jgi:hypothetical protein
MAEYTYFVNNVNNQAYVFSGIDGSNPTLTFNTGDVVTFNVIADGHPLWIKTQPSTGTANQYNEGVTNNGTDNGTITFIIPDDAPSTLYYNCQFHGIMFGIINIVPPTTTTTSTTTSSTTSTTSSTTSTTTSTSTTTTTTVTTATTPVPLSTTTTTTTTTTPAPLSEFYDVEISALDNINLNLSWSIEFANTVSFFDITWTLKGSDAVAAISINNILDILTPQGKFATSVPLRYFYKDNETYEVAILVTLNDGRVSKYTFDFFKQVATTTTTTTTTDSPLFSIIDTEDLSECPCGAVYLPRGSFYKDKTVGMPTIQDPSLVKGFLSTVIKSEDSEYEAELLHSVPARVAKENKFITCTNLIKENIVGKKLILFVDSDVFQRLVIENVIKITVKEYNTKQILGIKYEGGFNTKTKIRGSEYINKPSIVIDLGGNFDLINNALIVEISSICEYNNVPCCDSLPTDIQTFGPNLICIPLEDYYTQEEINPVTTTTVPPDSIIFTQSLQAAVEDGQIKLTAKITTYYESDFTYWIELLTSDCAIRVSDYLKGKPNELITFYETRYGSLSYRILVVSPTNAYSNTAFINYTTTTTTIPPDPEVTTSYTTAPPPPIPFNVQASFNINTRIWTLNWDVSNTIGLTDYVIQYRRNGTSTWILYDDGVSTNRTLEFIFSTLDCSLYQFRIAAKRGDAIGPFSAIAYAYSAIIPSVPQNLISTQNSNQLLLSWNPPADNGNCETITYIVQYKDSDSSEWLTYSDNYSGLSANIDLENGSLEYFARVASKNIAGESEFTLPPSQPSNLSISVIG